MCITRHKGIPRPICVLGLATAGLLLAAMSACQSSSHAPTRRTDPAIEPGWPRGNNFFHQVSYQPVKGKVPTIEGAEFVNEDDLCVQCHAAYAKSFAENVHRGDGCESCHGPASKHLETRGKEPGMIFSFKTSDPLAKAEACLRCHEENPCSSGSQWRTSKHAQCNVSCTDCHRAHYNVPVGTPATTEPNQTAQRSSPQQVALASYAEAAKPYAKDSTKGGTLPSLRGKSNNLGAVAPGICYRCHSDYREFEEIAGPHQICGPNGFNCTTCHEPHGQIREETRRDFCLECHGRSAPAMAWNSSIHHQSGVACTDCHNPHPHTRVPQIVDIYHGNGPDVVRAKRLMMRVDEPFACYKCHAKIYGLNALPSHHPIKEGKMVCSDCHDAHGQTEKNLKEASVNLVCYKCHAEKQGPFAFEHAPVRENCDICHEPHGTVANDLLKQPTAFLCLRCHSGHHSRHPFGGVAPLRLDQNPALRREFYSDCTQCHQQIHGTNRISQHGEGWFSR